MSKWSFLAMVGLSIHFLTQRSFNRSLMGQPWNYADVTIEATSASVVGINDATATAAALGAVSGEAQRDPTPEHITIDDPPANTVNTNDIAVTQNEPLPQDQGAVDSNESIVQQTDSSNPVIPEPPQNLQGTAVVEPKQDFVMDGCDKVDDHVDPSLRYDGTVVVACSRFGFRAPMSILESPVARLYLQDDVPFQLLVGVVSSSAGTRKAIRETWGGPLYQQLYFGAATQDFGKVQLEFQDEQDLVWIHGKNIPDGIKSLALLKVMQQHSSYTHILNTNDDTYVQMGSLREQIRGKTEDHDNRQDEDEEAEENGNGTDTAEQQLTPEQEQEQDLKDKMLSRLYYAVPSVKYENATAGHILTPSMTDCVVEKGQRLGGMENIDDVLELCPSANLVGEDKEWEQLEPEAVLDGLTPSALQNIHENPRQRRKPKEGPTVDTNAGPGQQSPPSEQAGQTQADPQPPVSVGQQPQGQDPPQQPDAPSDVSTGAQMNCDPTKSVRFGLPNDADGNPLSINGNVTIACQNFGYKAFVSNMNVLNRPRFRRSLVYVVTHTSAMGLKQRNAIRRSLEVPGKLYFAVQGPDFEKYRPEMDRFRDIIWIQDLPGQQQQQQDPSNEHSNTIHSTYNQVMAAAQILIRHGNFKHLVVVNAATVVHYERLETSMAQVDSGRDYLGSCLTDPTPVPREDSHKAIPVGVYPEPYFPPFCMSKGFVLSKAFVACATIAAETMRFFPKEGIAIGLLAQRCGIDPTNLEISPEAPWMEPNPAAVANKGERR